MEVEPPDRLRRRRACRTAGRGRRSRSRWYNRKRSRTVKRGGPGAAPREALLQFQCRAAPQCLKRDAPIAKRARRAKEGKAAADREARADEFAWPRRVKQEEGGARTGEGAALSCICCEVDHQIHRPGWQDALGAVRLDVGTRLPKKVDQAGKRRRGSIDCHWRQYFGFRGKGEANLIAYSRCRVREAALLVHATATFPLRLPIVSGQWLFRGMKTRSPG